MMYVMNACVYMYVGVCVSVFRDDSASGIQKLEVETLEVQSSMLCDTVTEICYLLKAMRSRSLSG